VTALKGHKWSQLVTFGTTTKAVKTRLLKLTENSRM
jgi:hypothetical protein